MNPHPRNGIDPHPRNFETTKMSAEDITSRLESLVRERYKDNEWALLPQVRNATGWTRGAQRWADFVAMNLWPSRGMEMHGLELKASRSDWLQELKDPHKADAICRYCHRWWVVAGDKDVVREGELPPTWGLMVASAPKRERLVVSKPAPELKPVDLDRGFIAAVLRSAAEHIVPGPPEAALAAARSEGWGDGVKFEKDQHATLNPYWQKRAERAEALIAAFQEQAGVSLSEWNLGNIAQAVKTIQSVAGMQGMLSRAEEAAQCLETVAANIRVGVEAARLR